MEFFPLPPLQNWPEITEKVMDEGTLTTMFYVNVENKNCTIPIFPKFKTLRLQENSSQFCLSQGGLS